jgi:hypothetical protein
VKATDEPDVLVNGTPIDDREARLSEGADELATHRTSVLAHRNTLVVVAGALTTTGLTAILLAWYGAAQSTLVEEQIPYLISGGLLGLALAVIGALTYFAHWLTVLVRQGQEQEARRVEDHAALMAELRAWRDERRAREEESDAPARSPRRARQLRSTSGRS